MTETPNADLVNQGGQTEAIQAAPAQETAVNPAAPTNPAAAEAAEEPEKPKPAAQPKAAAKSKAAAKPKPARRGPPPEGVVEARHVMLLTTSRLSSAAGEPLRRGRLVLVREGRLHRLTHSGKVRKPSATQLAAARRLGEPVELA